MPFGAPASAEEMRTAVERVLGVAVEPVDGGLAVPVDPRLQPLAFAHGWRLDDRPQEAAEKAVIRPATP